MTCSARSTRFFRRVWTPTEPLSSDTSCSNESDTWNPYVRVNSALNNWKSVSTTKLSSTMIGRILLPTVSSRSARHMARSVNGSTQNFTGDEEYTEPLLRRDSCNSVHYDSIYDSSEFPGSQRNRLEVMRKRLKSHFMTPYQKYKHRGRKPWKLLFQFLKLIMVTVQVSKQILLDLNLVCLPLQDKIIDEIHIFTTLSLLKV